MPELSQKLKDRYTVEYLETLDRIDNLKAELKEEVTERKGEIAALEKSAFRLRRLLAGKSLEQAEIPGAEIPSVKPRRSAESVTFSAGGTSTTIEGSPDEIVETLERAGRAGGKGRRRG